MNKFLCKSVLLVSACIYFFSMLLVACSPRSEIQPKEAVSILKPCPGFSETGKPPLVYGAQCGELEVKENPADANSRNISLNILRLPAISPVPETDPLILIQGGPGGSSVDMATVVYGAFADVRKNRDLIFVDQRGTGKSSPMFCERLSEADQLLPDVEQWNKSIELLKACAEKYHEQVPFYTTPYAAMDLDKVREALGYEKVNLWGGSYGTRVALEYMRQFPAHARAVILDGVAPVQIALPKYFSEDAFSALTAVNNECLAQQKCTAQFGNIVEKAEAVTQRLAQAEKSGNTITIQFEHPRNQIQTTLALTPKSFSELVFMSLYSRDLTVLLPHAISSAERGDYRLIASLSALANEQTSFMGISEGMRYSVICNEDSSFISPDDVANARPFLGLNMMKDFAEICTIWPKATLPENYTDPVTSSVPALLLSGHHDPVTPSRWAETVGKTLSNSAQLKAPGGNHSISMEGCVPQIISQFIDRGTMDGIAVDCVNNIAPLPLILGANEKKLNSSSSVTSSAVSSLPSLEGTQP